MKIIKEARLQESAFMVGEKTLSDITWLIHNNKEARKIMNRFTSNLYKDLRQMNIDALHSRYKDAESMYLGSENYKLVSDKSDIIQKVKSLQSYLYQCAEGDVTNQPLYKALEKVLNMPLKSFAEGEESYKSAYWGN